jgi:hypothetical protein
MERRAPSPVDDEDGLGKGVSRDENQKRLPLYRKFISNARL